MYVNSKDFKNYSNYRFDSHCDLFRDSKFVGIDLGFSGVGGWYVAPWPQLQHAFIESNKLMMWPRAGH